MIKNFFLLFFKFAILHVFQIICFHKINEKNFLTWLNVENEKYLRDKIKVFSYFLCNILAFFVSVKLRQARLITEFISNY